MSFEFSRNNEYFVIRDSAFDQRPRTELLQENMAESLVDATGRCYSAFFDGQYVRILIRETEAIQARWVLGSAPVRIRGGGLLDPRFLFTFFDYGPTAQRLNALWEFAGSDQEAVTAFVAAGFSRSRHDARLRGDSAGIHLRTRGTQLTGSDSAHAILHENQKDGTGEIHVGEHNPLRGFGIGFLLHQWEIRRG